MTRIHTNRKYELINLKLSTYQAIEITRNKPTHHMYAPNI
jgi:hypothetical protein